MYNSMHRSKGRYDADPSAFLRCSSSRSSTHRRNGWQEVQMVGPFPGDQVLDLEKKLKKWLRREVGLVPGTHENCFTAKLEVNSLDELEAVSAVETDLF